MTAPRKIDDFIATFDGALGVSRCCKLCKFMDQRRKVRGGGRGSGMREGNKQRGRLIQHIKSEHPEEYAEALQAHRERAARMKESKI